MSTDTVTRTAAAAERSDTPTPATRLPITRWLWRQHLRGTLGWMLAMAVVSAVYGGFWPLMGAEEMTDLLATMPEGIINALGYDQIGTAAGYLSSTVFGLLGPALLLVFAVGFGARVIGAEEEEGSLELETSLPVSRRRVYVERALALHVRAAVLAAVVFVVVAVLVVTLDMDVAMSNLLVTSLGLFLLASAMGAVAFAAGAATGRKAVGLAAGAGLAVAAFMADALAPLVEGGSWLATISPFSWYLGGQPLTEGIDVAGFLGLAALALVAHAVGSWRFARRDLGV